MQPIYTTRRGAVSVAARQPQITSFARNHNTIRHAKKSVGPLSHIITILLIVLGFALIYVVADTRHTSFDYEISNVETEITTMEAKKEDLAVEKARLSSIATAKSSTVAANMEDASVSGYATD